MNEYQNSPQEEARWRNFVADELRDGKVKQVNMETTLQQVSGKVDKIMDALMLFARMEEREKATAQRLLDGKHDMEKMDRRLMVVEQELPDDLERRLAAIEQEMPQLKENRRWVVGGVLAGLCMILAAVINTVLKS